MITERTTEDRICELAALAGTKIYLPALFEYDSDTAAKLMQMTLDGVITPTRVASAGPHRQIWEYVIAGGLYLLSMRDGFTEGFEPKDAGSFDRLAAELIDVDIHTF